VKLQAAIDSTNKKTFRISNPDIAALKVLEKHDFAGFVVVELFSERQSGSQAHLVQAG
jgi:hypothetical protein